MLIFFLYNFYIFLRQQKMGSTMSQKIVYQNLEKFPKAPNFEQIQLLVTKYLNV